MNEQQIKVVIGGLLYCIGLALPAEESKNYCSVAYDFLKDDVGIDDIEILSAVKYHNKISVSDTELDNNSMSYIICMANKIASLNGNDELPEVRGGEPLESVFNILNGNNSKMYYAPDVLSDNFAIKYPQQERPIITQDFYSKIKSELESVLKSEDFNHPTIRSIKALLETEERLFSYIPALISDISLFDRLKYTAAAASCIYEYLEDNNIANYKAELFERSDEFLDKKVFLLYSIDISGIQNFIYTINTEGALKTLRARSFYLEIFMEVVLDELLEKLNLSRANIIYTGGGHCYLLLANTEKSKKEIDSFEKDVNKWLLKNFNTRLFVAGGFCESSARNFWNIPNGSYSELFSTMSRIIGRKKLQRYSPEEIVAINSNDEGDGLRECKVCKSLDNVGDDGRCLFCGRLLKLSGDIMNKPFFTVVRGSFNGGVPLPFDYLLVADTEDTLESKMKNKEVYVRSYGKNRSYFGSDIAQKLFVGSYHMCETTNELAKASEGIEKLAVMRADVDNLGYTFVHGFKGDNGAVQYANLLRTSVLSRQLSLFFKYHINYILSNGKFTVGEPSQQRKITVVYSGGDDVFVIGAWNDVIGFAVDLSDEFKRFTEGTLSISSGIGIYDASFPISVSAKETEKLEDMSKNYPSINSPQKNAVTLFDHTGTYSWDDFKMAVVEEKLADLKEFFKNSEEYGKNFLYNLLFYVRNSDEKINIARYAYLLSRMEPSDERGKEEKAKYKELSQKLYKWIQSPKDKKELITAIYIYAYLVRHSESEEREGGE